MAKPRLALHWQILIGMGLGLIVGIIVNLAQDPIQATIAAGLQRFLRPVTKDFPDTAAFDSNPLSGRKRPDIACHHLV